ncbi:LamG-like jellyroll fold domain-containing protein, partial [uncultured Pseudokineococcus sp.]|uniref:LamG-like jellyroll fold domain-containing protein n=1 Tax=uncultured Pseudokineococcus sp. TaxID=1642928 RepID=UPI00262E83D8
MRRSWSKGVAGVATLAVAAALAALPGAPARAATASVTSGAEPATVSADVLPTVQVDGVVWDQVVVGDRVYVTGEFTAARPAGAPAGTSETPRRNLLAFDLRTGGLITSWAPSLDAQGLVITASADGRRIFVGGDFTSASGTPRGRVAAFDATTGALVTSFSADANSRVRGLAVAGGSLYVGGDFSVLGGQARTRLAAVSTSDGAVQPWAPSADREVMAVVAPAGSGRVVVGGRFETLNGEVNRGMGALDATSGAVLPWAANRTIQNYGPDSAIWSLSTDGDQVYGTGYDFYGPSDFENSFAASVAGGALQWVNGCLGDTYASQPVGGVLYTVGHAHNCSSMGGHPQTRPETYQRAMATTTAAQGKVATGAFAGQPAPAALHWLPTVAMGSYTKQYQGAWDVTGDDRYVVLGGEFPRVNGTAQQGLVRFAVRSAAPGKDGPQGYTELKPTSTALAPGALRVSWTSSWDRDDAELTYELLRGEKTSTAEVLVTRRARSTWWSRPTMSLLDSTAPAGSTQTYRVRVTDGSGNVLTSAATTATVPEGSAASGEYVKAVRADGAVKHWRLGETSGSTAYDWAGGDDLVLGGTATRVAEGAVPGNGATRFSGTDTVPAVSSAAVTAPQTFSVESWVRTTSTRGGKLVGFGSRNTGLSNNYDRHVYLDGSGRITFGVHPGTARTLTSAPGFNDGRWHQVVATLGAGGQSLYVDGRQVASDPSTTGAQPYVGFWRVGGDNVTGWKNAGAASLAGDIDEVSVYDTALTARQVAEHYVKSGRQVVGGVPNEAPVASFASSVEGLAVSVDGAGSSDADGSVVSYAWAFGDGATATGV